MGFWTRGVDEGISKGQYKAVTLASAQPVEIAETVELTETQQWEF